MKRRAAAACSSSWWKIADRYWVPTSWPCRFSVVGSWMVKKIERISRRPILAGSRRTCTTSAWPVSPAQTAS